MADSTTTETDGASQSAPKDHFAKAVDEAKAAAQALGKQAQDYAGAYREKLTETTAEWTKDAKVRSDEVLDRAFELASEGKTKATGALYSLGKLVEDNASVVDDRVGVAYGDYVRTAGKSIQDVADHLDTREFGELADEAREFVRTRPGVAIGLAAAGGFLLARMFKGSQD